MSSTLTEDEIDDVLYDSRAGDLESLQDFFKIHQNNTSSEDLLLQIKDEYSLKTPLHNAAANGHSNVVKYLISLFNSKSKLEIFINSKNESGNTALHWASLNSNLEIVKLIVETNVSDPFIKNEAGHDSFYEAESKEKTTNDENDLKTEETVIDYLLGKFSIEPTSDDEIESTSKDINVEKLNVNNGGDNEAVKALENLNI